MTKTRLALCLLLLGVFALDVHGQEQAQPNLLANPGFEETDAAGKLVGWAGPAGYELCKDVRRSGAHALRYENRDPKQYHLYKMPLTLDRGRRYEIEGWVRTEKVEGHDSGAAICIEFYGKDDKFLGGCYPRGAKGTHADWQRVHGMSKRVPDEAARCHLLCYLRRGMTGKAWWDDLSVRVYQGPIVTAITTDCYRGETTGGLITVRFAVELIDYGLTPDAVVTAIAVKDGEGKEVLTVPADLEENVACGRFDSLRLKAGTYTVEGTVSTKEGKVLGRKTCSLTRFDEPPARKAYIDRHRRLILDDEPFFPLGLYLGRLKEKDLDIIAKSPFNCLMPYGSPNREELDNAHARGIRVIYSVKDYYAGTKYCPKRIKTEADERPAIEEKVNAVKDHPAVMAWYINDELPLSMIDRLDAHRDWLAELDPQRPTWVVLYQVDQVRDYLGSFDVIGTDPYPIPERPVGTALVYARKTVNAVFNVRAVWMVPQIFNWGGYKSHVKPGVAYRAPTLLEMRSMAWQCIAAGANGLVFYSYSDLHKTHGNEPFEKRWADVTTMAAEIKRFMPILLSPVAAAPPAWSDAPETVAWRLYEKDGKTYLLAVNSGDEPASAVLRFAKSWAGSERLMGGKNAECVGDTIRLSFEPLEPKLLCLTPAK